MITHLLPQRPPIGGPLAAVTSHIDVDTQGAVVRSEIIPGCQSDVLRSDVVCSDVECWDVECSDVYCGGVGCSDVVCSHIGSSDVMCSHPTQWLDISIRP